MQVTTSNTISCIVSNCLKHNADTVYVFILNISPIIKNKLQYLKLWYYSSDGASTQYKNYKISLIHIITWRIMYFVTTHGKSPHGDISVTVKYLIAKTSH